MNNKLYIDMRKVVRYVLLSLVALVLVGMFVFLWLKSKPKEETFQEFEVMVRNIERTTIVTGKIEPRNEVDIKPQINGIIAELYKEVGQMVEKNEVIAKLKVIPDMTQLSSAESRVRLADINLEQMKIDYEREKVLFEKKLVSSEEYDKVLQKYCQAKEERSAAQDALDVIRDGVSSTNAKESSTLVRSTISGLILNIPVKVGNSVIQANTMNDGTTVATVANMEDLIFDGRIDETEVGNLCEGMPIVLTIGALPDYKSEAILEYIAPKALEINGANQFEIKASVNVISDKMIRSGYSANAEIVLEKAENVISVDESALEFSSDSIFVYLRNDVGYVRTPIRTGLSDGLYIEVLEGLHKGDKVRGTKIYK